MPDLFQLDKISQAFDGVQILDKASLTLNRGEIHVLAGANGTGKTVLQRIISGMLVPDCGQVLLEGEVLPPGRPDAMLERGIVTIHEKIYLLPDRTVVENIFLGAEPRKTLLGIPYIDWKRARAQTGELLKKFGLPFSPDTPVSRLTVGQQRMVEIIRAMSVDAKLLVVDEPTMFLSEADSAVFTSFIQKAKGEGTSFLLLTNSMGDMHSIADRISILHRAAIITYEGAEDQYIADILEKLSSNVAAGSYPKLPVKRGRVTLAAESLCASQFQGLSFKLHEGEILGIAGLPGSGARAVGKILYGLSHWNKGYVEVLGKLFVPSSPVKAHKRMGYVSGVNPSDSLIMQQNVAFNMTLPNLNSILHGTLLNIAAERELSTSLSNRLRIGNHRAARLGYLSGGNLRKVNFSRWIVANVKILILDEPTMGMDASARLDIYNIISELVLQGVSILFISSNFQELAGMCDRVLVMKSGQVVRHIGRRRDMAGEIWRGACG